MLLLVAMGLGIGEAKSKTVQNVKYMGWDDEQKKLVEMTTPEGVDVTVLTGGQDVTLGEQGTAGNMKDVWYVCNTPATESNPNGLYFNGISIELEYAINLADYCNVHLILADDCTMTVKGFGGIYGEYSNLFIYGQGGKDADGNSDEGKLNVEGMNSGGSAIGYLSGLTINGGQVTATSESSYGTIYSGGVTINGGQVTVTNTSEDSERSNAIFISKGNFTINGGQVTATSSKSNAIYAYQGNFTFNGGQVTANASTANAIYAYQGNFTFNGGQVTATSSKSNAIYAFQGNIAINGGQVTATSFSSTKYGINASNKLTLGWTNPTDYILCSSYNNTQMETVSGKSFAVYNDDDVFMYVIGAASSFSNINSLGNRIYPFEGKLVPVGSDKYYAYNLSSGSYKPLNPGVSVYLVTGIAYNQSTKQYEAVLSEAQPGVVPDVPVIFGADKLPNSIALKEDATVSLSATPSENFIACDGAKTVAALLPSGVKFADVYFFGLSGNSFKRVLLGSDDVHPAGTCFLFIPKDDFNNPPSSAPAGVRGIGIETDGTTSLIGNGQLTTDHAASAQWYSLDGRRLDKAPKTKGVYIRNGKKLVIK